VLPLSLTFIGPASPGNSGLMRLIDTTMKSNMYQPFVTKSQNQFAKMLPASSTDGDNANAHANNRQKSSADLEEKFQKKLLVVQSHVKLFPVLAERQSEQCATCKDHGKDRIEKLQNLGVGGWRPIWIRQMTIFLCLIRIGCKVHHDQYCHRHLHKVAVVGVTHPFARPLKTRAARGLGLETVVLCLLDKAVDEFDKILRRMDPDVVAGSRLLPAYSRISTRKRMLCARADKGQCL
jgi:hypothetical protein